VEFRILGSLEVAAGAERLELGGARQQIVLATLLLSADKVVSMGRLQEAIYGEDLPPTARPQAQMSVRSLRRLFAAHGPLKAIAKRAQGYLIHVGDGRLDSRRFEELVAAGQAARDAGQLTGRLITGPVGLCAYLIPFSFAVPVFLFKASLVDDARQPDSSPASQNIVHPELYGGLDRPRLRCR
jgi:DNA-binding SARP family transcriptional activator